jgi:hypothetical protein
VDLLKSGIMCSLHNVYEINVYRSDLSVCMIQLVNHWTDLDDIWCGNYATEVYPKIVLFSFLHSVLLTWQTNLYGGMDTITI